MSTLVLHESHEPVEEDCLSSFLSVLLEYSTPLPLGCLSSSLSGNLLKTEASPSRRFLSAGPHFQLSIASSNVNHDVLPSSLAGLHEAASFVSSHMTHSHHCAHLLKDPWSKQLRYHWRVALALYTSVGITSAFFWLSPIGQVTNAPLRVDYPLLRLDTPDTGKY